MNIDLKTLPSKIQAILEGLRKYLILGYIIFTLLGMSFLLFRINTLSSQEPSDSEVAEKSQRVPQPKIDQKSIDNINKLQDQNLEVKSLFTAARDNPFNE
jgi:hypothetical protein